MLDDIFSYVDPNTGEIATASRKEIKAKYSKPLPTYKFYNSCAEFWEDYLENSKEQRQRDIEKMKELQNVR